MKHKQRSKQIRKGILCYGLATLAFALSILFWTRLVGALPGPALAVSEAKLLAMLPEEQIVLSMLQGTVTPSATTVTRLADDEPAAMPEQVARAAEPQEHAAEPQEHAAEPPEELHESAAEEVSGTVSELSQWELRPAYTIAIPSLGIRAPVLLPSLRYWQERDWELLEEQMQAGLLHGAVAYPHSVRPGAEGSLFIAGHSSPPDAHVAESAYGRLFARLAELHEGDAITVTVGGSDVSYEVVRSAVVPSFQTSILAQQKGEGLLELITCYPIGSTKDRLVVTARLLL